MILFLNIGKGQFQRLLTLFDGVISGCWKLFWRPQECLVTYNATSNKLRVRVAAPFVVCREMTESLGW